MPKISSPERLASVEQRLTDHEARCEERLAEIKASAGNTLKAVEGLKSRFWAIVLSLLAWALAQVWAGDQARIGHLERAAPIQEAAYDAPGWAQPAHAARSPAP
jgi:hypothetical protein